MINIFKEKLGFSISQKFDGTMEVFMANGINYLEVRLVKGNDKELIKRYINTALAEKERLGFEIYTVHLPQLPDHDLSSLDEETRLKSIENQKTMVEMSMCLKPSVIVLHPDVGTTAEKDWHLRWEALVKSLKVFAPWCKERGLKIALENLTQISAFQTSEILVDVIERAGQNNVGICFDVNHLFPETHREFIKRAGKHILTMHVSDNDGQVEKHYLPGDGVINWKELFELLEEINYNSTMICECGQILGMDNFPEKASELKEKWLSIHT